jgi:hypothetical protein
MADEFDDWIDKVCEADPLTIEADDEPRGPPLTDSDLDAGLALLIQWQSAQTFASTTGAMCRRCRSSDYFNRPRLKFLHDAYVLADFARLKEVEAVRLANPSDQWPDGYVKLRGQIYNIEVTSTHGGRLLGQEYKGISGPTLDPVENWIERANSIPKYLDQAIGGKIKKKYASPCWLVIYLNINEYGIRQSEIKQIIVETKARYSDHFVEISILWKGELY